MIGGHPSRPFEPLERVFDRAVAATGLKISRIEIVGLRHADEARIYDIVDATNAQTLFGFRPRGLRDAIVSTRPWVRDVEIIRDWPDRLRLVVHEREPFAVLHHTRNGKQSAVLIDATGAHLGPVPAHAPPPLPQVFGGGADRVASRIIALTEDHPDIAADVLFYEFVSGRRWSLHLRNGRTVHLPSTGTSVALSRLAEHLERPDIARARIIDLRRPGIISIHDGAPPATQAGLPHVSAPDRRG